MNVLLTTLTWPAAALAACAAWATMRSRHKRHAARARYTAEAIHEARTRIATDRAAAWLAAHDRAVTDGRCTPDCPAALDAQWQLAATVVIPTAENAR